MPRIEYFDCLETGCEEAAEERCFDCREEYCLNHLYPIPGLETLLACADCLALRIAETAAKKPAIQEVTHARVA